MTMHVSDADRSLIKFNLAGIPADSSVTSAELRLCFASILSLAVGRTHEINRPTAAWAESSVTWNTQPGGNSGQTITWTVPLITGCISLDVKATVQAWAGSTSNFGWRITDQNESSAALADVQYVTREDADPGLRPTLNVTYTPP
jgi:hypothetical protein